MGSAIVPTFANNSNKDFYAYYTKLSHGESWEKYSRTSEFADVIVHFGIGQLVFWETSNGKWPFEEIVPRKGDGTAQMPDRTNTYSNVKILEATENQIVLLWRYLPNFSAGNPHGNVSPKNFVRMEEL